MSYKAEIDKQLAELEALVGDGKEGLPEKSEEESRKKRKPPGWLTIIGVAAVIDLAARFFVPGSRSFVLLLEALIFATAGLALVLPVVRKKDLTDLRRKIHSWLAAAFSLGAIRSAMWGFGIPVEYANLTIFVLALTGLAAVYFHTKRKRHRTERTERTDSMSGR